MSTRADFLLSIVNALGVFALVTIAYAYILKYTQTGLLRSTLFGLMFGTGACLAIANTTEFVPGLFIDPRAVMLALAGPFGGLLAASLAAAMTCALRLHDGGVGAHAGVMNILATAALGVLLAKLVIGERRPIRFMQMLALGFLSNVPLLFILAVPVSNAPELFLRAIGPLTVADTIGVLVLGKVLCDACSLHRKQERLAVEARTDPLTGLSNRRDFERRLQPLLASAHASVSPVSLLVIDVDHFKAVNDTFGHETGDTVLAWMADVIRQHVRNGDLVSRYGGEEIVVAMPGAYGREASIVAERIRRVIEEKGQLDSTGRRRITVSVGVSTAIAEFATLFSAADEALYAAKARGRNQVVMSGSGLSEAT